MTSGVAPAGRRRITEAQLRATRRLAGAFAPTEPGKALAAFKRAAAAIGLAGPLVLLIDLLMAYTRPIDWDGQGKPIVWPSNMELATRLDLSVSRVKVLLRMAIDAGLILPVDHGTRKRFGARGADGRILWAYGFDLSPLAERLEEFNLAATEFEARCAEARRLRQEISWLRGQLLDMADYAAAHDGVALDAADLARTANAVATPARGQRDPLVLVPIVTQLRALQARAAAAIAASVAVETGETDPAGPENKPLNTTTNQLPIADATAPAGRCQAPEGGVHGRRHPDPEGWDAAAHRSGRIPALAPAVTPGGRAEQDVLRGFVMTPTTLLQIAPTFRNWLRSSNPTWPALWEAADGVRQHLGISQHAWGQACLTLGRRGATVAVATIAAKHEAGLVSLPGGYLRRMIDRYLAGELRLDRTLHGLLAPTRIAAPTPGMACHHHQRR